MINEAEARKIIAFIEKTGKLKLVKNDENYFYFICKSDMVDLIPNATFLIVDKKNGDFSMSTFGFEDVFEEKKWFKKEDRLKYDN